MKDEHRIVTTFSLLSIHMVTVLLTIIIKMNYLINNLQ